MSARLVEEHESRILIGLNYARRRARFNAGPSFSRVPRPPLLRPFLYGVPPPSSVDAKVGFKRKLRGADRKMVPRRVLPLWFIEFSLLSIREQVSSALSGCRTRTRHISINVSFTKFLINFAFY